MKRLFLVVIAVAALGFGALVALDVVSFETDRADRWAMILAFALVVFCVGVATAIGEEEPKPTRAAQIEAPVRQVPATLGSLKERMPDRVPSPAMAGSGLDIEPDAEVAPDLDPEPRHDQDDGDREDSHDVDDSVMEHPVVDVDLEDVSSSIPDSVPVDWSGAPVTRVMRIEPADEPEANEADTVESAPEPTPEPAAEPVVPQPAAEIEPVAIDQPETLAHAAALPDLSHYSDAQIVATVLESEEAVIRQMIEAGQLSTDGPITDDDVAVMVYLACTTDDLLEELRLRKATNQPITRRPGT